MYSWNDLKENQGNFLNYQHPKELNFSSENLMLGNLNGTSIKYPNALIFEDSKNYYVFKPPDETDSAEEKEMLLKKTSVIEGKTSKDTTETFSYTKNQKAFQLHIVSASSSILEKSSKFEVKIRKIGKEIQMTFDPDVLYVKFDESEEGAYLGGRKKSKKRRRNKRKSKRRRSSRR